MILNNKEDWWKLVDQNWKPLINIMAASTDLSKLATDNFTENGKHVEVKGEILSKRDDFVRCKNERNAFRLLKYLHIAYGYSAENDSVKEMPCWNVLNELCNKSDLLYVD